MKPPLTPIYPPELGVDGYHQCLWKKLVVEQKL
jgi:hypothetical protein